jgi:hypothetical protein
MSFACEGDDSREKKTPAEKLSEQCAVGIINWKRV